MFYGIKIDVTKIDKKRLFKSEKTGNIYLDVIAIETKNNEYGDTHMLVQSLSEDERKEGKKGNILGNMRPIEKEGGQKETAPIANNDLPF